MILGKPTTKCEHGVFKAGEEKARYCCFCNPELLAKRKPIPVTVVMAGPEVEPEVFEVMDALAFMDQDIETRLQELGRAPDQYDF